MSPTFRTALHWLLFAVYWFGVILCVPGALLGYTAGVLSLKLTDRAIGW